MFGSALILVLLFPTSRTYSLIHVFSNWCEFESAIWMGRPFLSFLCLTAHFCHCSSHINLNETYLVELIMPFKCRSRVTDLTVALLLSIWQKLLIAEWKKWNEGKAVVSQCLFFFCTTC